MDIFTLIKNEHKQLRSLLSNMIETTPRSSAARTKLVTQCNQALLLHNDAEEQVFYARLMETDARAMVLEALEEHHVEELLLGELVAMDVGDERWAAKVKVLKEVCEHHIEEEEEEIFEQAQKILEKDEPKRMAREFETQKHDRQKMNPAA